MADSEGIRTAPSPKCILCGGIGETIYSNLEDRLFGAVGKWQLRVCHNLECGILWLDPKPLNEDIGAACANYYTHKPANVSAGLLQKIYRKIKRSYWECNSIKPGQPHSVVYESVLLAAGQTASHMPARRSWLAWWFAKAFNLAELVAVRWRPDLADCSAVTAVKGS